MIKLNLSNMQDDKNAIFQMRFPQKLWYLLNLRTDAILWGGTGRTILLNYRILHNYLQCDHSIFKTTNISSFVRQLNLYGFRKVTSHLQDPLCNSSNPYMHEYVHDYFQYGRPEFLNKITRKALAMKRNFKPKNLYSNVEQLLYLTPLQKARRALRMALKKAAQDLFEQNSPKHFCNLKFECDDSQDDYCEDEENIEFDWLIPNDNGNPEKVIPETGLLSFLLCFLFIPFIKSSLLISFPNVLVILPFPQPIFKFLRMMLQYQKKQILHSEMHLRIV
ncbi:unnamed protein product [Chrysodeixis includens]|uniref:HSF-type DNA-binding domain-containing protein n=1 Tax=Chrysodeixis includens TaxID=689277 RepID=A0A9P0C057_CHRIL|nr:unnamed protein product [Chrysodeixis includens]